MHITVSKTFLWLQLDEGVSFCAFLQQVEFSRSLRIVLFKLDGHESNAAHWRCGVVVMEMSWSCFDIWIGALILDHPLRKPIITGGHRIQNAL